MFYADLKSKPNAIFKRLTGVQPTTFLEMCQALKTHVSVRGRKPKLCLEDRLLLTLMYWREYRTYVHIAQTYGLSESAVCRTVHAIPFMPSRRLFCVRVSSRCPARKP